MLNEDVLGGGATLLGLPLPLVLKGLSILSAPTGCDGIVDMSAFNSLGNIGSISSLLNSLHNLHWISTEVICDI